MGSSSSGVTAPRVGRRLLVVALLTFFALAVTAPAAGAHAAFVSSQPEPGAELTTTPGVVEIVFSEPLIADLSSLVVIDPEGRRWDQTGVGEHTMQASLDTTALGVYEVEWKTVSPIDGHTLRGSYRFGVGADPAGVEAAATVAPQTSDLLLAAARAVEYAGLLAAVGMLFIGRLGRQEPALGWVRVRPEWALAVALVAGVAVVVGEALLAAASPSVTAVVGYLSAEPGIPRLVRLAATTTALVAVWWGARRVTAGATAAAIAALAAGGHAAAANAQAASFTACPCCRAPVASRDACYDGCTRRRGRVRVRGQDRVHPDHLIVCCHPLGGTRGPAAREEMTWPARRFPTVPISRSCAAGPRNSNAPPTRTIPRRVNV